MNFYIFSILVLFCMSFNANALESLENVIEFQPGDSGKSINLVFNGLIVKKSEALVISNRADDSLLIFLDKVISVNKLGDKKKIISLWKVSERNKIETMVNQPRMLNHNTSLFKNMRSSKLLGYIEYGEYIVCFVEHDLQGVGAYRKMYPLVQIKDKYFQSNGLSNDFLFSKVFYDLGEHIWPK